MYLLRTTLQSTGALTKLWLMVAIAGSTTNGIRNKNKENVKIPKKLNEQLIHTNNEKQSRKVNSKLLSKAV